MNPGDLINDIQKKPYETRVKILWGTVGVAAIIIVLVWVVSLKSSLGGLSAKSLTAPATSNNKAGIASSYGQIERAEVTTNNLKIYFNFNNTTDDILNVPPISDIALTANNQEFKPTQILDRQGDAFVQKVLSHTQAFGILVFPKITADKAELNFDQMFFERSSDQPLSQTFELDLKTLEKKTDLRN